MGVSKSNLSSIKHVDFGVGLNSADSPLVLFNWLVELANIESLTVSYTTLQVLSSIPDLLKIEFPSLRNLKSLKVKSCVPLCFYTYVPYLSRLFASKLTVRRG